ncbi:mechanosensitive ion channel family protein [Aestuariirhabdus sp. Z084]|uniref:mechanosensitive ion channel family protein n=1 Tax=Aestuariirhabdus haliotis TaxID=2918751 RepID=UPI00201B3AC7|nr:mechanosensitive ion channel family protein [Aestuariirhabdus haliotis]MCL6414759.1 mechanosensitive ion channel family protein [Aestuariirhabdus haliotis]MCL6418691.1 mechanosensitive ion channel family protein [Aestuariirhabdus haliotis]
MKEYLQGFGSLVKEWDVWTYEVFLVVSLTLIAQYIATLVLRQLSKQTERTQNRWDDVIIKAAEKPLSFLIWVIGFGWAIDIAHSGSGVHLFDAIDSVRDVLVVWLLAWFLVRLVRGAEEVLGKGDIRGKSVDETSLQAISKLLRASIIITASLVALQTLGYSISGVLAFGGIGGIAIGFAAKDLLANFFGGLTIYLDRPFKVGDWIRSPDKQIEGTVEYIGWRQTRIRTFDKRPLYVPNSTFTSISVENPSRMSNRRIYETIGLRYDDSQKVEAIIRLVKNFLQQHPAIDTNQTLIVNFNSFGPSSLDFFVYCFTKTTNWVQYHEIKQEILLGIMSIIDQENAEIAFPTRTLHAPEIEAFVSANNAPEPSTRTIKEGSL